MLLSDLIEGFLDPYPAGIVLDKLTVEKLLKKAVRHYAGYAVLSGLPPHDPEVDVHSPVTAGSEIDEPDFQLNQSEYAIIRPLFEKYVERENAVHLEASRGMGLDVYGRTVTEIDQDITQLEADLSQKAFVEPFVTV